MLIISTEETELIIPKLYMERKALLKTLQKQTLTKGTLKNNFKVTK